MQPQYSFISKANDLELGDVIQCHLDGPFSTAIVRQIDDDFVTLYRPYGHKADFSYTGGVICYVGIEEFKISKADRDPYFVYQRSPLR